MEKNWLYFVCIPVCSCFTLGSMLAISGMISFVVANYMEQYTGSDRRGVDDVRQASYILFLSGSIFLIIMIGIIIWSKAHKTSKRRVTRANEEWRNAMLRLIEEANLAQTMPPLRTMIPPPPSPPYSRSSSSGDVTPPPRYESSVKEDAPPSYDVAVNQLPGVHGQAAKTEETSGQNDR